MGADGRGNRGRGGVGRKGVAGVPCVALEAPDRVKLRLRECNNCQDKRSCDGLKEREATDATP